jgi:hypothetical protein
MRSGAPARTARAAGDATRGADAWPRSQFPRSGRKPCLCGLLHWFSCPGHARDRFGDRPIAPDHARSRRRLASEFFALQHSDRDRGRVLSLDRWGTLARGAQPSAIDLSDSLAAAYCCSIKTFRTTRAACYLPSSGARMADDSPASAAQEISAPICLSSACALPLPAHPRPAAPPPRRCDSEAARDRTTLPDRRAGRSHSARFGCIRLLLHDWHDSVAQSPAPDIAVARPRGCGRTYKCPSERPPTALTWKRAHPARWASLGPPESCVTSLSCSELARPGWNSTQVQSPRS